MIPHTARTAIVAILTAAGTANAATDAPNNVSPATPETTTQPSSTVDQQSLNLARTPGNPLVDQAELNHPHNLTSILVRLDELARERNPQQVDQLIAAIGETRRTYRSLPGLLSLTINDDLGIADAIQIARQNPHLIEYAEVNHLLFPLASPTDPLYPSMWHLHNTGQSDSAQSGTPGADINAEAAWDIHTGDPNFVLGVIDGGIDPDHADIIENRWTNPNEIAGNGIDDDNNGLVDDIHGWDFFDNDNDTSNDANHGTHVAGTIAAQANNGIGTSGVMWEAQVVAIKFIGPFSGSTDDAIASVDYAFSLGLRLTNNSWGGGAFNPALLQAIEQLGTIDSLFVAASGNDAANQAAYPARYDADNIIAVDGSDNRDLPYNFGNSNPIQVDIAAPGVRVLSSVPTDNYAYNTGTSMASPHVAGVVGLVTSLAPELTAPQIKQIVLDSARPVAAFDGLSVTGGIVDAEAALLSTSVAPSASLQGLPDTVLPGLPVNVSLNVSPGTQGFSPSSVNVLYAINDGPVQSMPATPDAGNQFVATLPPVFCSDELAIGAAVTSLETGIVSTTALAVVPVGELEIEVDESFETDTGWTVTNTLGTTDGQWERGQPVNFNRGNPTTDSDGNGWAYLTDNNPNSDNSDVDNGTTTVTSPVYNVSGGGTVSFDYWYSDIPTGPASADDSFEADISTDGGNSWQNVLTIIIPDSSWRSFSFELEPTAQFQIRFSASDLGEQNVIEAAVDNIVISGLTCNDPEPTCITDLDSDGSTGPDDLFQLLAVFGTSVTPGTSADFSNNGTVGPDDLFLLLAEFGNTCP